MPYYKDLREHIRALEARGKLVRIPEAINKDTELMPLVRWQFRGLAEEYRMYKFLRYDCGLSGVQEVAFPESCGGRHMCVIRLREVAKADAWQALYAAAARNPSIGKYFIAVDEDIDPHDAEAVNWALTMRTQPHQDLQVIVGRAPSPGEYSAAPPQETGMEVMTYPTGGSAVLIDATMP